MRSEEIELQRHSDDCAAVAVVNFFRLRGEPAPSVAEVWDAFARTREAEGGAPDLTPTPLELLNVLAGGCGFLCVLAAVPPALWDTPGPVLRHYLDIGCSLFVSYR